AREMQRIKQMMNEILAENTGKPLKAVKAATERDNFLTPQAALEFGLIDKVMESRKEASKTDA
ncbi:MAG: ATP-dependent Clp protease proteolytic subunit, partial [Desulfovibrio sp.]|nr:ATP-dependent Clp protease proteolytic subunit [Desulfovibrio sp.]